MGLIARAFDLLPDRRSLENPSISPSQFFNDYMAGTSDTGIPVTQESSTRLASVWRAVSFLSATLASLPLPLYEILEPRGRRRAREHPIYELIHSEPNIRHHSFWFRELMMTSVLMQGNAYGAIRRDGGSRPREIWPLIPSAVEPRPRADGGLVYVVRLTDGGSEFWQQEDIIHIPGLGFDGVKGKSVLGAAREAIGLGLAAQKFGGKFFKGGMRLPGLINVETPGRLNPEQRKNLSSQLQAALGGPDNWDKIPILDRSMKYQDIGVKPEDAQFLETRQANVIDICRFFGIPPHKLYDLMRATFSNIEHQSLEWVIDTVRPWAIRWEMELNRKLLSKQERQKYFAEFLLDGLLRGDMAATGSFFGQMRQWGIFSANDCLEILNRPDIGDKGDIYLSPINMVPAEQAGNDPFAPPSKPSPSGASGPAPADVRKSSAYGIRGLRLRRRLKKAQRPLLEEMGRKLMKAETDEVRAAIKRHLRPAPRGLPNPAARGMMEFRRWLNDFYRDQEGRNAQKADPVFRGYGELIAAAASEEVGADGEDSFTPEVEAFLKKYSQSFGAREADNSKQQILALLREAEEEASADEVEVRMDEWEEKRPGKIADREGTQLMSAVSKVVFVAAGITVLKWASNPGACAFCQGLDGLIVDVEANFVNAGQSVAGGEGDEPMIPSREVGHPPLHGACQCDVVPG